MSDTVGNLLCTAARRINRADARILLSFVMGCPREKFIAHPEIIVPRRRAETFLALVDRVAQGFPVPYILGKQSFWSRDFLVTPDVLIPRPDTETLVEFVIERAKFQSTVRIADLGTGSGCIAITLALELPQAQVTATDISPEAIIVAHKNSQQFHVGNITFREGSWFAALPAGARFDYIVSNPPYIDPTDDHLKHLRYEPLSALTDGDNGLSCLEEIIHQAPHWLSHHGSLVVEHGYDQGAACRELFAKAGFHNIATQKDLGDNERITHGIFA